MFRIAFSSTKSREAGAVSDDECAAEVVNQRSHHWGENAGGGEDEGCDVEGEAEDEVAVDGLADFSREGEKRREQFNSIIQQYDVGGLKGDICAASAHGDADVGGGEGGGVVDAVADKCDEMALLAEGFDLAGFVGGE